MNNNCGGVDTENQKLETTRSENQLQKVVVCETL